MLKEINYCDRCGRKLLSSRKQFIRDASAPKMKVFSLTILVVIQGEEYCWCQDCVTALATKLRLVGLDLKQHNPKHCTVCNTPITVGVESTLQLGPDVYAVCPSHLTIIREQFKLQLVPDI